MRERLAGAYTWLELHARWSVLRTLGNSNLVKASVLMPAFGYMLLLNDNVHQYLTVKYDGRLLSFLPSLWRVWLLFYGSFLLAFASILYSIYCPATVKRYASPYERADAEAEYVQHYSGIAGVKKELQETYENMSPSENKLFSMKRIDLTAKPSEVPERLKYVSNGVIQVWLIANLKRPTIRVAIFLLFAIGLGLVAVPGIVTFLQVTLLAVKSLFT